MKQQNLKLNQKAETERYVTVLMALFLDGFTGKTTLCSPVCQLVFHESCW